jgi:hypothetical protein
MLVVAAVLVAHLALVEQVAVAPVVLLQLMELLELPTLAVVAVVVGQTQTDLAVLVVLV